MITLSQDSSSFYQDTGRLNFVTLSVLFMQMTCLSIAITWIKIAGAGGKRGKVELPLRLKVALYTCETLKVLTVFVVVAAGIMRNAQVRVVAVTPSPDPLSS